MIRKILTVVLSASFFVSCSDIWKDEDLPPSPRKETKKEKEEEVKEEGFSSAYGESDKAYETEIILDREMFTGERVAAYLNPGDEVHIEFRIWKSVPKFFLETVEIEARREEADAAPCELILGNYTRAETPLIFEEGETPSPLSITLGKTNLYPLNSFEQGDIFAASFTVTEEDIKDDGDALSLGLSNREGSEKGVVGFLNFGNCSKAQELLETLPHSFNSYELTIPIVYRAEIFLAVERATTAEDEL